MDVSLPIVYLKNGQILQLNDPYNRVLPSRFPRLIRHSYLWRWLLASWVHVRRASLANKRLPHKEAAAREALKNIKRSCMQKGVPLMAFVFPYLMPKKEYPGYAREDYPLLLKLLEELEIETVDLHSRFAARDLRSLRRTPHDFIHLNEEGRWAAMRWVYEALSQEISALSSRTSAAKAAGADQL